MIPTAVAIGEKYTYFISDHYKFLENEKPAKETSLNSTNNSFDSFNYHLAKCDEDALRTMKGKQIRTFYSKEGIEEDDVEEDIWRTRRELGGWVEEKRNLDKPPYCKGNL